MLPFTSLNAASATGDGAVQDLEEIRTVHTLIASTTGNPSDAAVDLWGSHDGTTWVVLGTVRKGFSGYPTVTATAAVRFLKASVPILSGGTSPTVTATIASR